MDVDLEFSSPGANNTSSRPAPPPPGSKPVAPPPPEGAQVKHIDSARAAQQAQINAKRPPMPNGAPARPPVAGAAPRAQGSSALAPDMDIESMEIVRMREHVKQVEFEAGVKVALAEFKVEMLTELLSDTKLMQHQVEQLLVRINAKHPDMKNEVLMIKKILADFAAKKRK